MGERLLREEIIMWASDPPRWWLVDREFPYFQSTVETILGLITYHHTISYLILHKIQLRKYSFHSCSFRQVTLRWNHGIMEYI